MNLRWLLAAALVPLCGMANDVEALKKKAEAGDATAQCELGYCYEKGKGVPADYAVALRWYRKAADQNLPMGLNNVGAMYSAGLGVPKDEAEAVKWFRKSAELGFAHGANNLGNLLAEGRGTPKNLPEAYKWYYIGAREGSAPARENAGKFGARLTTAEKEQAQRDAEKFLKGRKTGRTEKGTGFFITSDGYVLTCYHVVNDAVRITVRVGRETIAATFVKGDEVNDLALLKCTGAFRPLPLAGSRDVRLGEPVFTVGFPTPHLLGVSPKFTDGTVNSLAGEMDDPRCFQINAAIQPGNSGGPLINARGCVVGVIARTYSNLRTAERIGGAVPQNVNYAVKAGYALAFLESAPEALGKLVAPRSDAKRPLDELASDVQASCVLITAE
jgi:S1-C subfamily serine protease